MSFSLVECRQQESDTNVILVPAGVVGDEVALFTQSLEHLEELMRSMNTQLFPQGSVIAALSTQSGKFFGKSTFGAYDKRIQRTFHTHNLNVIVHGGDFRNACNVQTISELYNNKENFARPNKIRLISCHSNMCAKELSILFHDTVCVGTRFTTYVNHDGRVLIGQRRNGKGYLVDQEGVPLKMTSSAYQLLSRESADREVYEDPQALSQTGIFMHTYRPIEEDLAVYLNGEEIIGKQCSALLTETDRAVYGLGVKTHTHHAQPHAEASAAPAKRGFQTPITSIKNYLRGISKVKVSIPESI